MKHFAPAALLFLGALALLVSRHPASRDEPESHVASRRKEAGLRPASVRLRPEAVPSTRIEIAPSEGRRLDAAERGARAGLIEADYEAMRRQLLAAYGAEGEAFPGGSHTLVAQLALLEREKRSDLANVLSPRELEDMEFRETRAGQRVQRALAGSAATDEQRRAVFRLQRAFELAQGQVAALTPTALDARNRAQQALGEQIRGVLGDELFRVWSRHGVAAAARFSD